MNCERLREEIQARLDEPAGAPLPPEGGAHLRECAGCAAFAREIGSAVALVRGTPEEEPPPGFVERVMGGISAEAPVGVAAPVRRLVPLPLRMAAAVAVVAVGGYVAWRSLFSPEEEGPPLRVARSEEALPPADARRLEERPDSLLLEDQKKDQVEAPKPLSGLGYEGGKGKWEGKAGAGEGKNLAEPAPPVPAPSAPTAPPPSSPEGGAGARKDADERLRKLAAADGLADRVAVEEKEMSTIGGIDGAATSTACVSYSVQVGDEKARQRLAELAFRYASPKASVDLGISQSEVASRDGFPSSAPAAPAKTAVAFHASDSRLLDCLVDRNELAGFDGVLRAIPGVSVWQGPVLERLEPAAGFAKRSNDEAADREVESLARVVEGLASRRQAGGGEARKREAREEGRVARVVADGARGERAPARPTPSGPDSPAPASQAAAIPPARPWIPVRLYILLPAPASQPSKQ
ncbi:MAG TPA: hypothetical protein VFI25_16415 [Planctomycetota bacterium]|jgi:hypothetical protein|nr:hypothetical protein [Planctomycetota bacterium]